jgi:hypothetical protein
MKDNRTKTNDMMQVTVYHIVVSSWPYSSQFDAIEVKSLVVTSTDYIGRCIQNGILSLSQTSQHYGLLGERKKKFAI